MEIKGNRKPEWLRIKLPTTHQYAKIKKHFRENNIHTICESGNCPNFGECWDAGNATFMILGDICTRSCEFCNVTTGKPLEPDYNEPAKIAEAAKFLKLKHCVLTSVDRDDLPDGGAEIWKQTILAVKSLEPKVTLETLIPDFQYNKESLNKIVAAAPDIVSHNIETVERLTKQIRKQNIYQRSMEVLLYLEQNGMRTKSGLMLGLGETEDEVLQTMKDLRNVNCKILTLGQYLQPTPKHTPVYEYIHPDVFSKYKLLGLNMGFEFVESAPLVRSSYHAHKQI